MTPDAPMFAAADRNKDVILDVLRDVLPPTGGVLEIASGGGQHVFHFSAALPDLDWWSSDYNPDLVTALEQRVTAAGQQNLRAPLQIDVKQTGWPEDKSTVAKHLSSSLTVKILRVTLEIHWQVPC